MTSAASRFLFGAAWIAVLTALAWIERATGTSWCTRGLVGALAALAAWECLGFWMGPKLGNTRLPTPLLAVGFFYILLAFYFFEIRKAHGLVATFYVVAACKGGDIAAYYVGSSIGRLKLAPAISPKKTWEGAAGGLIASVGVGATIAWLVPSLLLTPASGTLYGGAVGIAGQIGDLFESFLKRKAGVKDSGNWPGLGGAFDMLDSLLLAAPTGYYLYPLLARTG